MRNLPSALMIMAFVYLVYAHGFHWIFTLLILGAFAMFEFMAKEGLEIMRAQIEELKARTENMIWATKLSRSQVSVNMMMLAKARGIPR